MTVRNKIENILYSKDFTSRVTHLDVYIHALRLSACLVPENNQTPLPLPCWRYFWCEPSHSSGNSNLACSFFIKHLSLPPFPLPLQLGMSFFYFPWADIFWNCTMVLTSLVQNKTDEKTYQMVL